MHKNREALLEAANQTLLNAMQYLFETYDDRVSCAESCRHQSNAMVILECASDIVKAEGKLLFKVDLHVKGKTLFVEDSY